MCHLVISPTCTAGNLSSKQSAVTIWFSEYQRLSENWAEGKEEKKEHFGFCNFFFSFFFFSSKKYHFPSKVVTNSNDSIMNRFTEELLCWPLQLFFPSEFVVLDFLVYLINSFNNSNQHKCATGEEGGFFHRWALLLLFLVMARQIVLSLLCKKMCTANSGHSFLQTHTHTQTFKHVHSRTWA